jgi:phenylalanyl-tRNA synthetase beta chain
MRLPLSWLREWVELPATAAELAPRLTMLGFEVEAIEPVAPPFSGVVVAEITAIAAHPQADKLRVCTVNAGSGAPLQIVCGAPNARTGLKTALATIGAELPGGLRIGAAKLRGVDSAGMLCSARELGLREGQEGILELAADAPVGANLRAHLGLDDEIIEIGITPNRGDAMSVLGIARELSAALGKPLRDPVASATGIVAGVSGSRPSVTLVPGAGCARFLSRIIRSVDNRRASPAWLAERLQRSGVRSISPIVDVTNLVLLEFGQPMHAYDLARVHGNITARRASAGESITLLGGQALTLDQQVLVIADGTGVAGLAGVMGGERTAISESTSDVFLEVAWFAPGAIAGRARRFGLFTDASQRFERGVDPTLQQRALARASALILQIAGGRAEGVDSQELPDELPVRKPVALRLPRVAQLLGVAVGSATISEKLRALGMQVGAAGDILTVTPPPWRFDIQIEADLIEEVARSIGLDAIPEVPARGAHVFRPLPDRRIGEQTLQQLLAARGYQEIVSFGFVDAGQQRQLLGETHPPALKNPISHDLGVMRTSLWPGLVQAARQNLRRQQERGKLFEIASCFVRGADAAVLETARIGGIAFGLRWPEQWGSVREAVDFYDIKADVEALLAFGGGHTTYSFSPMTALPPALHPGRSAAIVRAGRTVGCLGEMHPNLVRELELPGAPVLFELDYEPLTVAAAVQYRPLSAFPAIRRDISFTVAAGESFSRIAERVSVAASERIQELRIFDIYSGKGVESGRKSVALGLILQDISRTLTDKEADETVAAVVAELRTVLDAKLRD